MITGLALFAQALFFTAGASKYLIRSKKFEIVFVNNFGFEKSFSVDIFRQE